MIGINREYAVNTLRCAAATNQVRLHIRHFFPPLSSNEYQKLLFDEKSTDDDEDIPRILHHNHNNRIYNNNNNNMTIPNEVQMRRSTRRYENDQQYRHSTCNLSLDNKRNSDEQILKGLDLSQNALQSILNSRFKLIDLIDLLKKAYPNILLHGQKKELQLVQYLSDANPGTKKLFIFIFKLN